MTDTSDYSDWTAFFTNPILTVGQHTWHKMLMAQKEDANVFMLVPPDLEFFV